MNRVYCETKSQQSSFGKSFKPVIFYSNELWTQRFVLFTGFSLASSFASQCIFTNAWGEVIPNDTIWIASILRQRSFVKLLHSELIRARSAQCLLQICGYSRFVLMQNKQRYPTSRTKLSTDKTVGYFENKDKSTVKKKHRKSIS